MIKKKFLLALSKNKICRVPFLHFIRYKYFYIFKTILSKYSLIPRSESELFIDMLSKCYISELFTSKLLDLGTGCGVIALSFAKNFSYLQVLAVDMSVYNLKIAKNNINIKNIYFMHSNWFDLLSTKKKYNIIVSNPPYISLYEWSFFYSDSSLEPKCALITTRNGFNDLYKIIRLSYCYLNNNSFLFLEHGYSQSKIIRDALMCSGFINIFTEKDINGLYRISCGEK